LNVPVTVHDVARVLPDIPTLRDRCRALAVLDAALSPEWAYRYYSFNSRWAPNEEMASMRNGSGDEYSIVFGPAGVFIRGFDHESPMSPYALDPPRPWPGVVDEVPDVFAHCVNEPAFSLDGVLGASVCVWRQSSDSRWQSGTISFPEGSSDPDGSGWLFELLVDDSPTAYRRFAEEYYEVSVNQEAVRHCYSLRPLTDELVRSLNPELSFGDLSEDAAEIGYPSAP
jgi:hypothetical protein